ncbi:MAG: carboxylating nicotinate-nucleotide diphosphorylase [Archaeoglobaceae archaeon]
MMLKIKKRLMEFFEEDVPFWDVTFVPRKKVEAEIISKSSGVLAGIEVAKIGFEMFNVDVVESLKDGDRIRAGDVLMRVIGDSEKLFSFERTILNILMRMSGIATATAELLKLARSVNEKVIIAGTRKTTPGFRIFEKMAIEIGGGDPHRFSLSDCVLIKRNHIIVAGGLIEAIRFAKERSSFTKKIEVEISRPEEAILVAKEGVDAVMLDNFSVDEVEKTMNLLREERIDVLVEVSGGITPENVVAYAKSGVDVISSGYITHSSKALDFSLRVL